MAKQFKVYGANEVRAWRLRVYNYETNSYYTRNHFDSLKDAKLWLHDLMIDERPAKIEQKTQKFIAYRDSMNRWRAYEIQKTTPFQDDREYDYAEVLAVLKEHGMKRVQLWKNVMGWNVTYTTEPTWRTPAGRISTITLEAA